MSGLTANFKVEKIDIRTGVREKVDDAVAVESPVNLYVNDEHVVTLMASPTQKKELAVGWLLDEGIIPTLDEIKDVWVKNNDVKIKTRTDIKVRIKTAQVAKLVTTACGSTDDFLKLLDRMEKPLVKSDYSLRAEEVLAMVQELNRKSKILWTIAGTHSASLFSNGNMVAFAEDVGRHNAMDKVIGVAALSNIDFSKSVLISSGRQPADMVLKAARVGIPIVVSVRGPIESGIIAAEKTGITLICFARGQRMNVYTFPNRIIYSPKKS